MISVLVPSRHRPELAKRLLDSINDTKKSAVEVKFYLNDNDPTIEKYKELSSRQGLFNRIRFYWFCFFAVIRDFGKEREIPESNQ